MLIAAAFAACGAPLDGFMISSIIPLGSLVSNDEVRVRIRSLPMKKEVMDDDDHTDHRISIVNTDEPLSEADAVRILRAFPSKESSKESCRSAFDVLNILIQASSSSSSSSSTISTISNNNFPTDERLLSSVIEQVVDNVSPNILAAALRRLTLPPFLPSSSLPTWRRNNFAKQYDVLTTEERKVYEKLMQLLLIKIGTSVEYQDMYLSRRRHRRRNKYVEDRPILLPLRDGPIIDEEMSLNWYAMADVLYSLSNLMNILGKYHRNGRDQIIAGHLLTNISPKEQGTIIDLFENIIRCVSSDNESTSSFVRCLGARRLIRDVILPLTQKIIYGRDYDIGVWRNIEDDVADEYDEQIIPLLELPKFSYDRLISIISSYLILPHSLEKLNASDLSITLWSMTKIYNPAQYSNNPMTLQSPQGLLLRAFMKRLRKFSVRSSCTGEDLSRALWSVSRLISTTKQNEMLLRRDYYPSFEQLIPLSSRLPGEDGITSGNSLFILPLETYDEVALAVDDETLHNEAVIMFHTLLNEIVNPPTHKGNYNDKLHTGHAKLESLSLRHIEEILQAATTLHVRLDDIAPAIYKILQYVTSNPSLGRNPIRQCRSFKEISRILLSLQRLRVGTGIFDKVDDGGGDIESGGLESRCVQLLGERFLELVLWHNAQSTYSCDPKTLATILRAGVMMFQGTAPATKPILNAASILIAEESFLSSCNEFEVSNCLFAFAMAKHLDQAVFNALTDQMMDEDLLMSCTPSSASRAMWSCSMLLSLNQSGKSENSYKLVDLFHQLSPLLLSSSSLSSTDISCVMWAMAKSEYIIDRGIFDQLAEAMASDGMLRQSNTRLVSQALWSCGKMIEFEHLKSINEDDDNLAKVDESKDNVINSTPPPYIESAHKYVQFLSQNPNQLSPKQISQTIWAIGRLRLSDRVLVEEMGDVASRMHSLLNAREVANIIWGLSRVDYDKPEVVSKIAKRIMSPNVFEECTVQEASMLLFALAKLQISEEDALSLFPSLSMILKRQLNDATSQSIVNALWAHEALGIPPPEELLSIWAQDRLGMNVST